MAASYTNTPILTKIKLGNESRFIADKDARALLTTLLANHSASALKNLAFDYDVVTEIPSDATDETIPTAQAVYELVNTINKFDVVIDTAKADGTPTTDASSATMYKIYMVPADDATGSYVEWITLKIEDESKTEYKWEKIGTTKTDLSDYLHKTATVAGVPFGNGEAITKDSLSAALGLKTLAYKSSGSVNVPVVSGATVSIQPAGTVTINALTQTETSASLTSADYTPAGDVTGTVKSAGTITVTLTNADSASDAILTTVAYTPVGDITGTVSVPNSATLKTADNGFAINGSISNPTIDVTLTTASFVSSYTAGELPTFTAGEFTPATVTIESQTVATNAFLAEITTDDGEDTLVLTAATTVDVSVVSNFSGGTLSACSFSQGKLPIVSTSNAVTHTEVSAATPTFTSDKIAIELSNTNAEIDAEFKGTAAPNGMVTGVGYYKQVVGTQTFNPGTSAITATFSGTKVENALITGVTYDKATANGASFVGTTATHTINVASSTSTINVDFAD